MSHFWGRINLNIGYVFDENFAVCAAVSMVSLLVNNANQPVNFYIFDDGIIQDTKKRLEEMCQRYNASVFFIDVNQITSRLKKMGVEPWRGRYSVYVRLAVGSFLPESMERIILIDADTIVAGSITDLYSIDLHGHPCAMALEGIHGRYNEICGIGQGELYNGGVLMIDLPKWREKAVEERLFNHLTTVRSNYMLTDEDLISIVLKGDVERLSPKFNYITQFYYYGTSAYFRRFHWDRLGENFYTLEELQKAKEDVRIYHCIDTFTSRPWYAGNIHPYNSMYDQYLALTPWNNSSKKPLELKGIAKLEFLLRKNLPGFLSDYMYYVAATLFYTIKAKKYYKK